MDCILIVLITSFATFDPKPNYILKEGGKNREQESDERLSTEEGGGIDCKKTARSLRPKK